MIDQSSYLHVAYAQQLSKGGRLRKQSLETQQQNNVGSSTRGGNTTVVSSSTSSSDVQRHQRVQPTGASLRSQNRQNSNLGVRSSSALIQDSVSSDTLFAARVTARRSSSVVTSSIVSRPRSESKISEPKIFEPKKSAQLSKRAQAIQARLTAVKQSVSQKNEFGVDRAGAATGLSRSKKAVQSAVALRSSQNKQSNASDEIQRREALRKAALEAYLEERSSSVVAHEGAHLAAAGSVAQGLSLTYQSDGNGGLHAVGGSVTVDMSLEANPVATQQKASQIQNAALAPDSPSLEDQQVAMLASKMKVRAQMEKETERRQKMVENLEDIQVSSEERNMKIRELSEELYGDGNYLEGPIYDHMGAFNYEPQQNQIRMGAPVSTATGKTLVASEEKEVNRSPVSNATSKLATGSAVVGKKPQISEAGQVRKHLHAPDLSIPKPTPLVFIARLKTQSKPVVFTSQIAAYKSMENLLNKDGDLDFKLKLVDKEEFSKQLQSSGNTLNLSEFKSESDLSSGLKKLLAIA